MKVLLFCALNTYVFDFRLSDMLKIKYLLLKWMWEDICALTQGFSHSLVLWAQGIHPTYLSVLSRFRVSASSVQVPKTQLEHLTSAQKTVSLMARNPDYKTERNSFSDWFVPDWSTHTCRYPWVNHAIGNSEFRNCHDNLFLPDWL